MAYICNIIGSTISSLGYIMMKKGMHKVENTGLNGGKKKLGYFTW